MLGGASDAEAAALLGGGPPAAAAAVAGACGRLPLALALVGASQVAPSPPSTTPFPSRAEKARGSPANRAVEVSGCRCSV